MFASPFCLFGAGGGDTISAKFGNTVSGDQMNRNSTFVLFEGKGNGGLLCVGHSLTRHAPSPQIGWTRDCGMAASSIEKDYVHLLWNKLKKRNPKMPLCIAKGAFFERNFTNADEILPKHYKPARDFNAKYIVIAIGDNVSQKMAQEHDFITYFEKLVKYVNPKGKAKLIIATCYYPHAEMNKKLKDFAARNNIKIVDIGWIQADKSMSAQGLFEHSGVAGHPGDKGMAVLADVYYKALTGK